MHKFDRAYFEEGGYGSSYKKGYSYEVIVSHWKDKIDSLIQMTMPKRVLDLGCAKGFLIDYLRRGGVLAFGADISEYALNSAPETVRPYLTQMDISCESLPFPDGYFDLIICLETLEHLPDPEHAIKEVARCLSPKGRAFFSTPSPDQIEEKEDKTHCNIRSFKQWLDLFKRYGLAAKMIPGWKVEPCRGRLGRFPIFFRNNIRSLFYSAKTFLFGCKSKSLYIETCKIL